MIEFKYCVKNGDVFIHCATSQKEKERLETLLRQTETICRIVGSEGKTGLRIVEEFTLNGQLVVIFSLHQKVTLDADEIDVIRDKIVHRQEKNQRTDF